jgi:hypothetical protein
VTCYFRTGSRVNKSYEFSGLPAGSYRVQFLPPGGYGFTSSDQNADTSDSDADPVTGKTSATTLAAGQIDPTLDAGVVQTTGVAIGNLVWCDSDGNGNWVAGEPGLSGVTVQLYTATGGLVQTVTTDAAGAHLFASVPAGQYYVGVVAATVPNACGTLSSAGGGTNPDLGDNNDDGVPGTGETSGLVVSQVLDAQPTAQTTADSGNPLNWNPTSAYMTVDFGFTNNPTALTLRALNAGVAAPFTIPALFLTLGSVAAALALVYRRAR